MSSLFWRFKDCCPKSGGDADRKHPEHIGFPDRPHLIQGNDAGAGGRGIFRHRPRVGPGGHDRRVLHQHVEPEVGRPENNADFREICQACFTTLAQAIAEGARIADDEVHERAVAIWSTLRGLVSLGENAGPLYGQISPDKEIPMASRIVTVLALGPWPQADSRLFPTLRRPSGCQAAGAAAMAAFDPSRT